MKRGKWSLKEEAVMVELYPVTRSQDLADLLNRSLRGIYTKAESLGLKKTAAYIRENARFLPGHNGNATRFQPGNKPWNKGGKHPARGRTAETQFKKGRAPQDAHNYKPIGSTRIHRDNILERKVTDDPSLCSARRWVGVHRLVWIAAHGPIPPGMIVVFRQGMHTLVESEITLDRLECISQAENMARNTVHRLPKELAQLVQLRGALNRQLNKRMTQRDENH